MIKILMRMMGRPVASRAQRLARAFLDQTERAGDVQRDLLMGRLARHADSQFGRDHHFGRDPDAGRLSPPRSDQRLRSA